MEFSRQECWSGLSFPGDHPGPGIEPESVASPASATDSLPLAPSGGLISGDQSPNEELL